LQEIINDLKSRIADDHGVAIVIAITEEQEEIKQIVSEAEKQPRRDSDSPLEGSYRAIKDVPSAAIAAMTNPIMTAQL